MIAFLIEEIKAAAFWTKDVVILFMKWMFRWVLRCSMIGVLLFMFGKGCYYAASVVGPFAGTSASNVQQSNTTRMVSGPQLESERIAFDPRPPASRTADVRSRWSTLRYIVEDLSRWLRRR